MRNTVNAASRTTHHLWDSLYYSPLRSRVCHCRNDGGTAGAFNVRQNRRQGCCIATQPEANWRIPEANCRRSSHENQPRTFVIESNWPVICRARARASSLRDRIAIRSVFLYVKIQERRSRIRLLVIFSHFPEIHEYYF